MLEHIYSKQFKLVNTWQKQKQQQHNNPSLARLPVPGFTAKLKRRTVKMRQNTGNGIEDKVGNRRDPVATVRAVCHVVYNVLNLFLNFSCILLDTCTLLYRISPSGAFLLYNIH
jgi:hypothetical protein